MIQYVFGDDTFTARKKIHEDAQKVHASIRWVNKEQSENESLEELFESGKGSLLGNVFVVIQDPSSYSEEVRGRILAHCEAAYSGNVLLWDSTVDKRLTFHKKMKQLVSSSEIAQPTREDDMVTWVSKYAPDIPLPVVRELVARVGLDTWAITNEIDKLRVLPSPIQVSDVKNFVAQRDMVYSSAFPLLDAIATKKRALAVHMLRELLDGGASERFVLAMLSYQFRLFLSIRMGKDSGESLSTIHSKTGLHSIAIQKAMPMASKFSLATISEVLSKIAAAEKSLVTTTMDPRSIVTMLIIGLCS